MNRIASKVNLWIKEFHACRKDKFELSLAKVSKFAQLYVDRSSLNESVIILWWMGFY